MRTLLLLSLCGCSSGIDGAGFVEIINTPSDWTVYAGFEKTPLLPSECQESFGDCSFSGTSCMPEVPRLLSAGELQLDDGFNTIRLWPRDRDQSYSQGGSSTAFVADSEASVSSAGGAINGFAARITIPELSQLNPLPSPIPRDRDLHLDWTGGTDRVVVAFYFDPPIGEFICSFDAAAKSGVVPSGLLQKLPAGALGQMTSENQALTKVRSHLPITAETRSSITSAARFQ